MKNVLKISLKENTKNKYNLKFYKNRMIRVLYNHLMQCVSFCLGIQEKNTDTYICLIYGSNHILEGGHQEPLLQNTSSSSLSLGKVMGNMTKVTPRVRSFSPSDLLNLIHSFYLFYNIISKFLLVLI
jgi:hypothetical protein